MGLRIVSCYDIASMGVLSPGWPSGQAMVLVAESAEANALAMAQRVTALHSELHVPAGNPSNRACRRRDVRPVTTAQYRHGR